MDLAVAIGLIIAGVIIAEAIEMRKVKHVGAVNVTILSSDGKELKKLVFYEVIYHSDGKSFLGIKADGAKISYLTPENLVIIESK